MGVDLSYTATGCVVVNEQRTEVMQLIRTPGPNAAVLEARIHMIVTKVLKLAGAVDLTVLEGPAYARPNAAIMLGQLSGAVRYALWRARLPFAVVAPSAVKKFATGKGNADKKAMMAAAEPFFYGPFDHNLADALHLARYGLAHYQDLVE